VSLVGRVAGWDEKHFVQAETAPRRTRRRQVPGVDGIERSPEKCDIHRLARPRTW